jgi:hypothetical protein
LPLREVKPIHPKQQRADKLLAVCPRISFLSVRCRLSQIVHVLLQFALRNFDVLVREDKPYLFITQAQAQTFVRVRSGRAVRQFLFAVSHFKEIDVMGIVETAQEKYSFKK